MKDSLLALLPSAGVLFIFYLAIKALVEADRRERVAAARYERAAVEAHLQDSGGVVGNGGAEASPGPLTEPPGPLADQPRRSDPIDGRYPG